MMDLMLDQEEARVLACLVEKELTTPEYYPMTVNAITNACNQKSNRNPVVQYDEVTVQRVLDRVRAKGFAAVVTGAGIRTPKYRHYFKEKLHLGDAQVAILCELMLRGPQTPGELRGRAERMFPFADLSGVDAVLQELTAGDKPFIRQLPRQPGQKEQRYVHLLCGEPDLSAWNFAPDATDEGDRVRIAALEEKVESLTHELGLLKKSFEDWKAQFE